jgi:CheY-like chemotaxis protein
MATVLIVDDDAAIRASVRAALEDEQHTVLEARDGAGALELLRGAESPLVVLVDLLMPGVSGFDMLSQIAQDWELADRHAYVVFTANVESLPVVQALRSKIVGGGIAKPFDIEALQSAIEQAEASLMEPRRKARADARGT